MNHRPRLLRFALLCGAVAVFGGSALAQQPPAKPGAALSYMVTLADCLPQPGLAPFPEKPVGLFKEILDRGTIRQVVQVTTSSPNDTSFFFGSISEAFFQAMLDEINKHYNVNLKFWTARQTSSASSMRRAVTPRVCAGVSPAVSPARSAPSASTFTSR